MSVIVKGMRMPEKCAECPCLRHDSIDGVNAYQCNITFGIRKNIDEKPKWCPLVDLGEHGDLIDRDKVIPKLNFINEAEHQIYGRASWGFTAKCIHTFDDAPTVIEAEGK